MNKTWRKCVGDWGKTDSVYMIRRGGGEGDIVCVCDGERERCLMRGRKREMSVFTCSNLTGADYKLK